MLLEPPQCSVRDEVFHRQYYHNTADGNDVNLETIRSKYSYGNFTRYGISGSGDGSDLGMNTRYSLMFLAKAIKQYDIRSMLDVPCGDVNWQFHAWELDSLDLYAGLDIVRKTIRFQKVRFAHHKNKLFAHWDMVACPLPRWRPQRGQQSSPFDLVHMRHVIQHIGPRRGAATINNVRHSGARYLMVTTFPDFPLAAPEMHDGGFYPNNMARPPFNFPPALDCMHRLPVGRTAAQSDWDHACLYRVTDIPPPNMTYTAPTAQDIAKLPRGRFLRGSRAPRWKLKQPQLDAEGRVAKVDFAVGGREKRKQLSI